MEMYLVGGAVRDEIMGVKSKDLDYTVVLPPVEGDPFLAMTNRLRMMGYTIFLETPEHLTVRAQTPDRKETADFVLARKEGTYSDGRRPDKVEVGTLADDLARRDFRMNAIAKDSEGNYIDPYNGISDIEDGYIQAVGHPMERLREDALRAVRAIRFAVTKEFKIGIDLKRALQNPDITEAVANNISDERIQAELSKMFRYDTLSSLMILNEYPALTAAMFSGSVSLDATMKQKGRGR